ncbi:MAG TPA: hypothetical protein VLS96_16410 [Nodosilinea sp.]|nr:hypothetical protein [Nodosilinea sp.]
MRKPSLALATGALLLTLAACEPSTTTPDAPTDTTTEAPAPEPPETGAMVEDRSAFTEVSVPEDAVGENPTSIALATFGSTEPGEGNFEETVEVVEETADGALVLFTQTGLADDSVNGMRYRLEFVPEGDQWRLDWAGQQVRCQPNRGSQEWSTDLCS